MQVGILQNLVGVGGRSRVIAEVIQSFAGIASGVHIHTMSNSKEVRKFCNNYDVPDEVEIITHSGRGIPSNLYQQLALNYQSKSHIVDYDVVFNSNNCLRFLPEGPDYIHYIHFPVPSTPAVDSRSDKLFYRMGVAPITLLSKFTSPNISGIVFTNSEYTRRYTRSAYPNLNPEVLYPPCLESVNFNGFCGSGVASVGSFHPNKRQLFQLQIAEDFPDVEFQIIGSKSSPSYFEKCREFADKKDMKNVELLPDISYSKLSKKLTESRIFLHSMEDEHFGIATVEALNHGCVPVVHDSGGQREVVPWSSFRYTTIPECKRILESVIDGAVPPQPGIRSHLQQFTSSSFQTCLLDYLE